MLLSGSGSYPKTAYHFSGTALLLLSESGSYPKTAYHFSGTALMVLSKRLLYIRLGRNLAILLMPRSPLEGFFRFGPSTFFVGRLGPKCHDASQHSAGLTTLHELLKKRKS
jgi:hypothetical protein